MEMDDTHDFFNTSEIVFNIRCSECNIIQPADNFHLHTASRNKKNTRCKACRRIEKVAYYYENKDSIMEYNVEYVRSRRDSDPIFRFTANVRSRVGKAFNIAGYTKKSKTFDMIGIPHGEFIIHMTSQFKPWMTMENHGNPLFKEFEFDLTWDGDHIIPMKAARNEEDVIRLNHYTNFQPLCSRYNRTVKSDNLIMDMISEENMLRYGDIISDYILKYPKKVVYYNKQKNL